MINKKNIQILKLLHEKTLSGAILWIKDDPDSYSAVTEEQKIHIDFLYVEVTNRAGDDRLFAHVYFPGFNAFFATGTEGYFLVAEILAAAFDEWNEHIAEYGDDALDFLNNAGE